MKKYFTTPIYYANGSPHIGHFLTTTAADVLARAYRQWYGKDSVFFTTGLDEHGTTVQQAADKEGFSNYQKYVDLKASEWQQAFDDAAISYDYFVRTTNPEHKKFAQTFILKLEQNNDVYKGVYKGKYCSGCEKFLTLSDLDEEGFCPLHRHDQVIEVEEENYFFRLSKYVPKVKALIEEGKIKIFPNNKANEILARLEERIEDISISRPKSKVAWGISYPNDPKQTIYVWVEALINYLSSLAINDKNEFWKNTTHLLAKDISWFHNVIWPSMLLASDYPLYRESVVHSYLVIGGEKISKSRGNVITPTEIISKFGRDAARYLILANYPYQNDANTDRDLLARRYTADLANGLGNLISRVAALAESISFKSSKAKIQTDTKIKKYLESYRFDLALEEIRQSISALDSLINQTEVWKQKSEEKTRTIAALVAGIQQLGYNLAPFMPQTALAIEKQFSRKYIKKAKPLFPRI